MNTTEQRIAALEHENASRKTVYPVAGSLVKFTSQVSPTYSRAAAANETIVVRIRFTPNIVTDTGISLTTLRPEVTVDDPTFNSRWPRTFVISEPQTGDGSVVLRISIATIGVEATYFFRAISTGPSGGTFTLL